MSDDVGDRDKVRDKRRDAKLHEYEEGEALAVLMSSHIGRRWMYRTLEQCHMFTTSYSSSPIRMSFLEGERNIGLRLVADIMAHCPRRYAEMMQEASENVRSSKPTPVAASEPDTGFSAGLAYEFDHDPFDNAGGHSA
jgi:hypothetical protein